MSSVITNAYNGFKNAINGSSENAQSSIERSISNCYKRLVIPAAIAISATLLVPETLMAGFAVTVFVYSALCEGVNIARLSLMQTDQDFRVHDIETVTRVATPILKGVVLLSVVSTMGTVFCNLTS